MSPFEKKLATYQKSAEMRKSNIERSGSRGRPNTSGMNNTGPSFYNPHRVNELANPQIMQ